MIGKELDAKKNAKVIPANKERSEIIVDEDDCEWLSRFTWGLDKDGYAISTVRVDGKQKKIKMHRIIMKVSDKEIMVDHINGNKLDNRRINLRICNNMQNQYNSVSRRGKSKYKGVHQVASNLKWQARISYLGKRYSLGYFDCEIEAAKAYNKAALGFHKEFAKLNEIR